MSKYRINVRFDLDKPKEAKAALYLQSLDKSRNAFIKTIQRQESPFTSNIFCRLGDSLKSDI